jgi:HK97 family phage prohead protease
MLFAGTEGSLELRKGEGGSRRLSGRFPYNKVAVLSDGGRTGRPQKEQFASRAFAYNVDNGVNVHLLVGHSYDRPLASTDNGTLKLTDTDAALTFDATLAPELLSVSYVVDILRLIEAGLAIGLSPGFRIPPKRAVENAERVTQEPVDPARGMHGAIIRTILEALLFELSIVTRPAYDQTQVEARSWKIPAAHKVQRWRR